MQSDFKPWRSKPKPLPSNQTNIAEPAAVDPIATEHDTPAPQLASTQALRKHFWERHWTLSRKRTSMIALVAAVLLSAGLFGLWYSRQPTPEPPTPKVSIQPKPKAPPIYSNLSGLQVDAAANQRPVIGVMIENSLEARPQSGLGEASVVFEAIAEGGITRFLALYQDTQPSSIGPVRSVRPYYAQWCMSFDCALAHAGGSPEALSNIRTWGTKDLDQFVNGAAYSRIQGKYAPHNLYTSYSQLAALASAKSYGPATFTSFLRKKEAPSKTPSNPTVSVAISSPNFSSSYTYDAKTNSYHRSQAGAPHLSIQSDGKQVQITPKVIVALVMGYGVAADKHSQYTTTGSGEAKIFQDGNVVVGSWSRANETAPFVLTDATGQAVALNPGQTWIVAVSSSGLVR